MDDYYYVEMKLADATPAEFIGMQGFTHPDEQYHARNTVDITAIAVAKTMAILDVCGTVFVKKAVRKDVGDNIYDMTLDIISVQNGDWHYTM